MYRIIIFFLFFVWFMEIEMENENGKATILNNDSPNSEMRTIQAKILEKMFSKICWVYLDIF